MWRTIVLASLFLPMHQLDQLRCHQLQQLQLLKHGLLLRQTSKQLKLRLQWPQRFDPLASV